VLKGDPDKAGLYTIMLRIPAHTRMASHVHQDDRVATVVSGTWYIGYGDAFNAASLKALPAGSFYTEPSNRSHFAETRDEPVTVQITGVGPSSTSYIDSASDPKRSSGKQGPVSLSRMGFSDSLGTTRRWAFGTHIRLSVPACPFDAFPPLNETERIIYTDTRPAEE
jgi:hypothetical protein